ncbi:hypothetical protein BC461_18450 [Photobacterium damselae]|nr:hypothetical protein BC461_18450 [Photobacterium damselae]
MIKGYDMLFIALKAIVVQIGIIAILMFPKWLQAQPCQIEWQNEISLQDGRVNLQGGNGSFSITEQGHLYFDVHPVQLNSQQQQVLSEYYHLIAQDLPYVLSRSQVIDQKICDIGLQRQAQEHKIQQLIPALKQWQSVQVL